MTRIVFNILVLGLTLTCCKETEQVVAPTSLNDFITPFNFGSYGVPEDNPLTEEGVTLGRRLFYDVRLSENNTISCASCHQQSKAFTDGLRFSVGIHNQETDKSSMSLVNLLWATPRAFWDGRAISLEDQALQPIINPKEMGMPTLEHLTVKLQATSDYPQLFERAFSSATITSENIAKALASFQRTLVSQNSKYDQVLRGVAKFNESELRGSRAFFTHPDATSGIRGSNCGDCHRNILTDGFKTEFDGFSNNGLDEDHELEDGLFATTENPADKGKFKVPSLRNIALTAPYMHDGRFETLEEVLNHYNEHIKESITLDPLIREASNDPRNPGDPISLGLTEQEKNDIIAFLHTLTDLEFITNEKYANPFTE